MSLLKQLKTFQKPMYGLSLIIGLIGIVLSWILIFIFYSAIDTLEGTLNVQIDTASETLLQVEQTVDGVGIELNTTNATLTGLEVSLNSVKNSLNGMGTAATDLGNGLKLVSLGPIGLSSYADNFISVGSDMKASAVSMGNTASTFVEHRKNLASTQSEILDISKAIHTQRLKIGSIKTSIVSLFSSLKLAILLLVVLMDMAFLMLGINSIAGLLG
ncbi:MAG: hypothetical protein Q7S22_05280 [Candidatus Micrarchaeota archaeon]|nr:hypothetical protein [Candidatus Micrarchaeota archaeon]